MGGGDGEAAGGIGAVGKAEIIKALREHWRLSPEVEAMIDDEFKVFIDPPARMVFRVPLVLGMIQVWRAADAGLPYSVHYRYDPTWEVGGWLVVWRRCRRWHRR